MATATTHVALVVPCVKRLKEEFKEEEEDIAHERRIERTLYGAFGDNLDARCAVVKFYFEAPATEPRKQIGPKRP